MAFQIINLADHINAAVDKMNENFELISWTADSDAINDIINNYIDSSVINQFINSDTINNYIDQSSIIEIIDSDFIQSLILSVGIDGTIDSSQFYDILAETGIVARLDSVEGGFVLLAQDFTNLSTSYTNLDSDVSALSTAYSSLTSQISVLDSGVEVLSQGLVDLEAQFIGGIEIDSATIVQAVGGAITTLETRINANSDEISVVSQSITDLSADLALLDSTLSPLIQANATAISNIVASASANSDELEVLSGRFDSFQVTLQNAIDSGLEIDPDDVAAAVGGITDDLYTRIYVNSDKISVVSADITTLNSKLTLLDSAGALFDVVSGAVSDLRTDVEAADDSNFSALSQLEITLSNKIDSDVQEALTTVSNSYITSGQLTTAIQNATTSLQQEIDGDVQAALTSVSNTYATDGEVTTAIQNATNSLTQTINNTVATAEQTLNTRIDAVDSALGEVTVEVRYTLNLDANGHVAGIEFNNDGATADMSIIADKFGIVNASDNAIKPFTVDGDQILLSNATVTGTLNISSSTTAGSMSMTNDLMQIFDAGGNPRVRFGRLA